MTHVRYEVADHVAVITLDRPEALNAFTDTMEEELVACFDRSDADDDVRVVVLTGAGRAFCAGMDLSPGEEPEAGASPFAAWRASPTAPAGTQYDVPGEDLPVRRDGGGRVTLRIFESAKPVIAAINGHAVGVGITMTLPCDLRIMADDARFAFPFTRRGFVTESCSSWFLPRLVPMQRALHWVLTGATQPAAEALEAGLVLSLHPAAEVLDVALVIARDIAANAAPVSASLSRQLMWRMLSAAHPMTAHQLETAALNVCGVSPDADEGVASFLEKRPPAFSGRVSGAPGVLRDLPRPAYTPPDRLR
ncbi:enoyl-CoA hydratase-related protein [Nocardioides sp. LHD-245]|uniref:enoyl-CoA hydratase-related protein n=1 Tax=Nocardioides sp. LHD-245 TaxID=3051387 RepID=UPI0027E1C393|nr:enoyl-CoA hydratase-related protein [Nocardioides sp. LHD-245]